MRRPVIFDCDGTLVDSEAAATRVFPAYWATHGVHVTEQAFKERFIGKGNQHPDVVALHTLMPPHAMQEADRLWQEDLERTLQAVAGIPEVLAGLKGPLAVGSNSPLAHVRWALDKTNLASFFGTQVFSAEMVEEAKPAPDLFNHIAATLGVAPHTCWVVEDSVSGILAAKAAGMTVVAFTGASHFTPTLASRLCGARPDHVCSTARDLATVLAGR